MAGMFFTMQEVVEKLSKTEEQIQELIQEGKLREFRDGTKLLFKVSEVEALAAELPRANDGEPVEILPNDSEVVLEPVAEPSAPAVPSSSVPDLDFSEDAPVELVVDDDDMLLGDVALEDDQDELLLEPEPVTEELSLEDTLDLLAGDGNADDAAATEELSLEADDEPLEAVAAQDVAEEAEIELTVDEPEVELAIDESEVELTTDDVSDDSFDILIEDDSTEEIAEVAEVAEEAEDFSLEIEPDAVEASGDSGVLITSDESSDGLMLDDGDSLKLAETSVAAVEDKEEDDFDLGDSFDILMSDDSTAGGPLDADGGLLSDDTLGGLISSAAPIEASDDELLSSLTKADTAMGNTGINVLAETDSDFQLASDTKADTVIPEDDDDLGDLDDLDMSDGDFLAESAGLGNLDDDDLNLDSIGSGSGLLDLSLQADDTSLGAVLDDILPSEDEVETAPVELDDGTIADEAPDLFEESAPQQMVAAPAAGGQMAVRYEAPPTAVENACGVAMFLPALMIAFSAIVLLFGLKEISPKLLTQVTEMMGPLPLIWWIVIGASVLFLLILMLAAAMGGGNGQKKEKKAKVKKPKKAKKAKKAKKPKKAKKKK